MGCSTKPVFWCSLRPKTPAASRVVLITIQPPGLAEFHGFFVFFFSICQILGLNVSDFSSKLLWTVLK